MNAISIKGVKKSYGDFIALKNLSLEIKKGEFFGFLGPNGAGKTTTINIVTGLSSMNSGTVNILGNDVIKDYQKARSLIGLSPQDLDFDPYFSIKQILRYQAGYYGIKRKDALKRADKLLEMFDLTSKKNFVFRKLSGGMKRRLSIAKAMIHDPEILILDEPTAALDVDLRLELWDYLKKINKNGKTILLTTHYIEEAQKLCNRIGIINKGELIALDDKKKLMKDLSAKHLWVKTVKDWEKCPKFGLKEKSEIKKGALVIELTPNSSVDAILRKVQKKVKIEDIRVEEESLEDIFLKMVRK